MIVRTLQSIEEFKALEPHWRALHESSPEGSLFNDFDYTWVWWATFQSLGKLCIDVVEDDQGALVAIAPMYKTRTKLSRFFTLSTLRFIGRGSDVTPADLNVLFCVDNSAAEVAGKLLLDKWQSDADVQRILLEELPEHSRFFAMVHSNMPYLIEDAQIRWVADLPSTWQDFIASLSRNTRKRIKHRRNRLAGAQTLRMDLCSSQSAKEEALAALITLHKERRHSKGDSAAFSTENYIKFHESLLAATASRSLIQFVTLRDGGEIVGVEYLYRNKGVLLFNQTGFKPQYESLSPGHNMMVFAIESAIDEGMHSIDLLLGDYQYKQSYASTQVKTMMVTHYSSWVLNLFARLIQSARNVKASLT